jgi:rhodanese-related sulfurtransferase
VDPWIVAIGAAVALVAIRLVLGARRAPPEQVRARLAAGATVIDVRSPREFEGGAFPGARNIPLTSLAERLREIPRDRPVVLYCASGMRSASAARLLARSGFGDVVNAGGLRHMPRQR